VRYPGTHPRRFEQKYKEHAPERHPGILDEVRARGMTPAGSHVPILVEELLAVLAPRPGERALDATLGHGGHAQRLLAALGPDGVLLGLDADPLELARSEARLRALGYGPERFVARRTNFAALEGALAELGWDGVDVLLADLGVSSMQLDDPARGFSFKLAGPLDMRMNPRREPSARQWLERVDAAELEQALRDHADEPHAALLARAIERRRGSLVTTLDLAELVRGVLARWDEEQREASVRRVFQAVRIAVNDEFAVLEQLLRALPRVLRPGGRAALLTFHSGEDRRVKKAFEQGREAGIYAAISDEVVRPGPAERRDNPRAAPAKLRWARRA